MNHNPNELIQTQDLEPIYEENSNIYIFSRESFDSTSQRIGNKPYMFISNPLESVDIDNNNQWNIVEALLFKNNLMKKL